MRQFIQWSAYFDETPIKEAMERGATRSELEKITVKVVLVKHVFEVHDGYTHTLPYYDTPKQAIDAIGGLLSSPPPDKWIPKPGKAS